MVFKTWNLVRAIKSNLILVGGLVLLYKLLIWKFRSVGIGPIPEGLP
jgi:hypothetical protein